jgi:hypothetical protein
MQCLAAASSSIPGAGFLHHYSPAARTPPQSLFLLEAAYRQYLWSKNIEHTRRNTCLFVWGMIGRMVASLLVRAKAQLTGRSDEPALNEFQRLLKADVMRWRHGEGSSGASPESRAGVSCVARHL